MDLNVGRLIDLIEELGLRQNTRFIFSNDNGVTPVDTMGSGTKATELFL